MSKKLAIIDGLREVPTVYPDSEYVPCELHISSFYGGVKRGRCIQISMPADKAGVYSHIQLTTEGIEQLRKILNDWDDEYKP